MRRGIAPLVVWVVIALLGAAVAGNTLADSKNPPTSPLYPLERFSESAKASVLSIVGQEKGYVEQLKEKRVWDVNVTMKEAQELKQKGDEQAANALEGVADQIAVEAGLKAPKISVPATPPESRPIKGVSSANCGVYCATAPSVEKIYTLNENQPVTLDTGQKVTLAVAYRHISTGELKAAISVEYNSTAMDAFLTEGVAVKVGSVTATLTSVPRFGTAIVSFKALPPKTQPVICGYLMRFGSAMSNSEMQEVAEAFETSIENATGGRVQLCLTVGGSAPLPPEDAAHRYSEARSTYPWLRDESLPRMWYADKELQLYADVKEAALKLGFSDSYDVLIVLSEAQALAEGFDSVTAKGFTGGFSTAQGERTALRNIVAVQRPYEQGAAMGAGYSTQYFTAYQLSDIFVHEMGHYFGLRHACPSGCAGCGSADVMSVGCVAEPGPQDAYYRAFSKCSLDWISNEFLPVFMKSGAPPWQPSACA